MKEMLNKYIVLSQQLFLEIENKTDDVNENISIQIDFKWFKFCLPSL